MPDAAAGRSMGRRLARAAALLLGVVLAALALAAAAGSVDWGRVAGALAGAVPGAGESGPEGPGLGAAGVWGLVGLMGAGVLMNVVLSAGLFWSVTRSFDARPTVGLGLMVRLIAASSLLNYLPLRAGLIGRAAYLKARHGLAVRQSLAIVAVVLAVSAVVTVVVVLAALRPPGSVTAGAAGLLLLSLATPGIARRALGRAAVGGRGWVWMRAADVAVSGLRFWAAMRLVGQPIDGWTAMAAGAAGSLVALAGLTPNGLGMSEWAAGLTAGLLAPATGTAGLAAKLVDRAVEVVVIAAAGGASLWTLRGGRGGGGGGEGGPAPHGGVDPSGGLSGRTSGG